MKTFLLQLTTKTHFSIPISGPNSSDAGDDSVSSDSRCRRRIRTFWSRRNLSDVSFYFLQTAKQMFKVYFTSELELTIDGIITHLMSLCSQYVLSGKN